MLDFCLGKRHHALEKPALLTLSFPFLQFSETVSKSGVEIREANLAAEQNQASVSFGQFALSATDKHVSSELPL